MAAASRKIFPFKRPRVIGCGFPVLITRIAASTVVGRWRDFAKLLKVPIDRTPSGCLVSTSLRTVQPMVPSPPATMIVAVGPTSFSMSILGSNSTTRLPSNALRSLASISGVIEPALELRIRRLVPGFGFRAGDRRALVNVVNSRSPSSGPTVRTRRSAGRAPRSPARRRPTERDRRVGPAGTQRPR